MNVKTESLTQAISDLRTIRRAVEQSGGVNAKTTKRSIIAKLFLHSAVAVAVTVLITGEVSGDATTNILLTSASDIYVRAIGLMNLFWLTVCFGVLAYAVSWIGARSEDEDYSVYLTKNFPYLDNFALISDLAIKYAAVALVIISAHPEYVAPLLMLFVGDYLFSGRIFVLPAPVAMTLGAGCFAAALTQYLCNSPAIIWPLTIAAIVVCASTAQLVANFRYVAASDA